MFLLPFNNRQRPLSTSIGHNEREARPIAELSRTYLTCLGQARGEFDLIFIDPPYRFDYGEKALQMIAQKALLSDKGIAMYERDRPFEGKIEGLEKYDERKYGKAYLTFFRKQKEEMV